MSEENISQEGNTEQNTEQKEYTPVEQEAMAQGWVPKDEFQGDEAKWVEAGEFIRRGELFKKIDSQAKEVKDVRKALQNFKELFTKVKETEYNRALAQLKAEIKLANREQDFDRADELEAELESVEKEAKIIKEKAEEAVEEAQSIHPEFAAWTARNEWYISQPHMKVFADRVGAQFAAAGLAPAEVLKKVEAEVKKEFPQKFTNPNKARPSPTEGASSRGASRGNDGFKLSEQEEKVCSNFVRQGVMTREEYIKSIKAVRGPKE
jgi:hypothetical protein